MPHESALLSEGFATVRAGMGLEALVDKEVHLQGELAAEELVAHWALEVLGGDDSQVVKILFSSIAMINKVVCVFGGTRGIGKSISELFLKNNYRIAYLSRTEKSVKEAKSHFETTYVSRKKKYAFPYHISKD
ncbi:hypothetical protein LAZ67_15002428 [Cordylochernes scorpioides]|uniref:Uncharacterized protein n=1 Tax=Cordylochernes scorpioides TaxID=51811 RepID=A0ABY6L9K5_9ARAC|nr:hypothetical protein LAZ67_15002428 [Cordylochernes scorpioides]